MKISGGKKYSRILVRCTNWLGDAIMTTPFFSALKKLYPWSRVEILALPYIAPVFENNPNVDMIRVLQRKRGISGLVGSIGSLISRRGADYDLGISLPNSIGSAIDLRVAGCREILGYNREMRGFLLTHAIPVTKEALCFHEIFYYMNILRQFAGDCAPPEAKRVFGDFSGAAETSYEIYLTRQEKNSANAALADLSMDTARHFVIGVNPGAYFGSAKRWFTDRYKRTVESVAAAFDDARFLVFGSDKEKAIGSEICSGIPGRAHNLCGKTGIRELFALISKCSLFVTNDSGAMHAAAAFEVPIVAIFGSTDHKTTFPVCRHYKIIRHDLPCSPCKKRECPLGHHDCMKYITVDKVATSVKNEIERIRSWKTAK